MISRVFKLRCKVNGKRIELEIDSSKTLLEFIRDDLGLKGTKEGCGEGECGACMVLVQGKPVNSCLMMAVQADGKEITTIEGLAKENKLHPLQKSFIERGAVQCGFCTPGFIISAHALLKKNSKASVEKIKKELTGNLCRCTGYEKIIKAVEQAKRGMKDIGETT